MSRIDLFYLFFIYLYFFPGGGREGRLSVYSKIQVEEKDTNQLSMIALRFLKEAAMQE